MAKEEIKNKSSETAGIKFVQSTDKVAGFKDDTFVAIEDEFEQVRKSRTMYIGGGGNRGAIHLFYEIFNNALDECNNPESPSKNIYVSFSEKQQKFTVGDEGRGIPTDVLKDAVMHKHYTTKSVTLSSNRNKKQTGLNGKIPMPF